MAPIILSARLCGELEDLVLRTPSAKERCRAQAVLWLAEGSPPSKSPRRSSRAVRPSTDWVDRFLRRDDLELSARLLDAPRPGRPFDRPSHRPLDCGGLRSRSPRVGLSCHGLDRRVAAAPLGARSWDQGLRQEHQRGDRTPGSPLETAPASSWRHGRRPGAKQKGAETRPEGSHAQGNLDAGRDDRHGDTSAV